MKKIKKCITICTIFGITLLGCRSDDNSLVKNNEDLLITQKDSNAKNVTSRSNQMFTIQEKCRETYFSYYKNNLDTRNKNFDYKTVKVDFSFSSQVINIDDNTKIVLFPFVMNNIVKNVVVCKLTENDSLIEYYFPIQDEYVVDAIAKFNLYLNSSTAKEDIKTGDIDEVVIVVPPKAPLPPLDVIDDEYHLPIISPSTGGVNNPSNPTPTVVAPTNPVDIKKFLSCFNIHQPANLTIFAQKTNLFTSNGVGHAFISITQGNNTMTFGFYPKDPLPYTIQGPGIFGNDGGHAYTSAWNMGNISPTQLQQIIGNSLSFSYSDYNVGLNNCADFVLNIMMIAGVNTNGNGADTPTTINNLIGSNATSTNGNAPSTHRTCP